MTLISTLKLPLCKLAYLPNIKESTVAGFLVGSEALYRDDMTASQLADKINSVRDLVANIKDSEGNSYSGKQVGTVDSWNVLVAGYNAPAIQASFRLRHG